MIRTNSLSGVTVLDFTLRLPGPLATSILGDLGAHVTKIELKEDPFNLNEDLFLDWYKEINKSKTISKLLSTKSADIVIVSGSKVKELVKSKVDYKVLIEVASSKNNIPMHDLNALAESTSFKRLGDQSIPFIPVVGVQFANEIAIRSIAALYQNTISHKKIEEIIYLDKTSSLTIDKLAPSGDSKTFLHNGQFPCYNIYKLKDDNKIALAAVEDHLWAKFCEIFKIFLHTDDRFDTTELTSNKLKELFASKDKKDVEAIIENNNVCITII
jgi:hypothetical protein